MSHSPFIPFYTSDFLGGTGGMTAATKGVYITLLCLMYEAEKPLAQSWDILARRCGCTLPAFKNAVQSLVDDNKASVSSEGIWSQTCDKHIAQRRERSGSAKAAAKTRWEKDKQKQCSPDASASVPQCKPEPEPELYKKEIGKPISRVPDGFDEFWQSVPRKIAKSKAQAAYASALRKTDARTLIAAMRQYAESRVGKDAQYTAHPASWLNAGRWQDEPDQPNLSSIDGGNHGTPTSSAKRLSAFLAAAEITPPMDFGQDCNPSKPLLARR